MAPEPNPIDNLNTIESNSAIIRMPDSDSEDENVAETSGYMPLSQIPIEGEPLNDEEDDDDEFEWTYGPTVPTNSRDDSMVDQETLDVWSSTSNGTNIEMDADKINKVKSAMASFSLPNSSIPEWANAITEEQLINKIKEIQNNMN